MAAGMLAMIVVLVMGTVLAGIRQALRRGWKPTACLGLGVLLLAGWLLLGVGLSGRTPGLHLVQEWQQELQASLDLSLQIYRRLGWSEADVARTVKIVKWFFIDAIVSWTLLALGAVAWLGYLWQRRLTPDLPGARISLRPFSRWKVPEHFIWAFILALAGLLLGSRAGGWMRAGSINLLVLLSALYLLNGAAVAVFQLEQWQAPKVFRMLLIMAACLFPGLCLLLLLVGIFDTWWDWRGRLRPIS